MKAIDCPFTKIINGTTQFVIPVFQRDYSWTETQCEQLWNDIIRVAEDQSSPGHFTGSIVYAATGDAAAGFTKWLLIDGQQRMTTLTLLLAALRDHLDETGWRGDEDGPTAKRIQAYFLKNAEEDGLREYKLVLRRHDNATLQVILNSSNGQPEWPSNCSDRIKENYEYFRERLADADPAAVYRGIGKLIIVDVTLDRTTDDAQLVFESLNSTGMDLSQSDLIRNFILISQTEKVQTLLYEKYWCRIESLFRGSESTFDAFARDYLALKTRATKQEKAGEIYVAFRNHFKSLKLELGDLEAVLQDMLRFARYYAAFSLGRECPESLASPLAHLRRLVDVPGILIMRLFECFEVSRSLTEDQFIEAIQLLESYVLRRAICGAQTRGYWQVFANLAYAIKDANALQDLKINLARQRENYRFPIDEEFRRELFERNLYELRVCRHLLDRLENADTKEPTDTSRYTIEHIMPRNEKLSREWREMLGNNWQVVHKTWLHRLGNLTLTGYNSEYQDRSFDTKKTTKGGFNESSIRLNAFVREQKKWSEQEIKERGKILTERAIGIWPMLHVGQAILEAADQEEKRELAAKRDASTVQMSQAARQLFDMLSPMVRHFGPEVLELAEAKSVSYHSRGFFLEVLPRKNRLILILPLDFNELDTPTDFVEDASERAFFVNSKYEGGVYVKINEESDIDKAMAIIRQAYGNVAM